MTRLSAPSHSGHISIHETPEEAREAAAELLGIALADMIEVGPVGGDNVTYCYSSQADADADADQDGAYAVQYKDLVPSDWE